jgi:hypothetical protein
MKRSAGITISVVISILGSVALVLMGGLSALSFLAMKNAASTGLPQNGMTPKLAPGILLAITFLIYIGPGVWGIVSAIGLWRLRNWARRCFVIFGGLLGFFSFCGAFVMFVAMRGVSGFFHPKAMCHRERFLQYLPCCCFFH